MPIVEVVKTIAVTGEVLRTPQTALMAVASLHGTTPTYPTGFTPVSTNALIAPPATAPTATTTAGSGTLPAGTYQVSYAWASDTAGTATTTASPTVAITFTGGNVIRATPTATRPPGALAIVWYVGTALARLRTVVSTSNFAAINLPDLGNPSFPEPTINTSAAAALVFGRSDDESGNYPIPIPQAVPTTTYSWYKSLQLVVLTNGTGNTFISNIAIAKSQPEANGLGLYYRTVAAYTRCSGITGLPTDTNGNPTGKYPANDLTAHAGIDANTPVGYTRLPSNPATVGVGPYWSGNVGALGPVVQFVLAVGDRNIMTLPPGTSSLPSIAVYYDEV